MESDSGEIEELGKQSPQERCERAREIARIAARMFAERGFDATPVRAIAEAAGVTCPTLYYYFGSKEGLAQALLIRPMERLLSRVRDLLHEPLDPVERLVRIVEAHFAYSREDPDRARLGYAVMFGPLGVGLAPDVNRFVADHTAALTEAVKRLDEVGIDVSPEHVADLVLAVRGQCVVRSMEFLYRGGTLESGLAKRIIQGVVWGHARPVLPTSQRSAI
jgi:AcrR family transcriptional regulator